MPTVAAERGSLLVKQGQASALAAALPALAPRWTVFLSVHQNDGSRFLSFSRKAAQSPLCSTRGGAGSLPGGQPGARHGQAEATGLGEGLRPRAEAPVEPCGRNINQAVSGREHRRDESRSQKEAGHTKPPRVRGAAWQGVGRGRERVLVTLGPGCLCPDRGVPRGRLVDGEWSSVWGWRAWRDDTGHQVSLSSLSEHHQAAREAPAPGKLSPRKAERRCLLADSCPDPTRRGWLRNPHATGRCEDIG